jgi:general secretion pathway protein G
MMRLIQKQKPGLARPLTQLRGRRKSANGDRRSRSSEARFTRIQIQGFSSALDLIYLDNGGYPTSAEGLGALSQKPDGAVAWNGPYLDGGSVPKDPWGRPYVYKFPGRHGAYDIVSLGPEGRESDASLGASVVSWQQ